MAQVLALFVGETGSEEHGLGLSIPQWVLELSILLAGAVVIGLIARRVRLPLTAALVFVGFVASWIAESFGVERRLEGHQFEEVLVFIFLPALIFAAALGLSSRAFFRNLMPILMLAIVSLFMSAALIATALYFGLGVPVTAALLFGVFISATDPVAVVAIFRQLGVPERLLTMVEGESMLNDGVAIVGFSVLLGAAVGTAELSILGGIVDFLFVFFGGAVVGAVAGFAAVAIVPRLDRLGAAALSVAVAYGGSVLAP